MSLHHLKYGWDYCLDFNFFNFITTKEINSSPWGRALRAVREDEDAVRAMGKNAVWLKLQSFMLGAGIAGLSGVFLHSIMDL
jgi:ABC-type branched-subunit amino acid transport system permease subunit